MDTLEVPIFWLSKNAVAIGAIAALLQSAHVRYAFIHTRHSRSPQDVLPLLAIAISA